MTDAVHGATETGGRLPGWRGRVGNMVRTIVVLTALCLLAWGGWNIWWYHRGEASVSASQAEMNAELARSMPRTVDVDGRTLDVVGTEISFAGRRQFKSSTPDRLDIRIEVKDRRDLGRTSFLRGREGSMIHDLQAGTAVLGIFRSISYERPGMPGGMEHVVPDEPKARNAEEQAAYDVWYALMQETHRIPLLRWAPSEVPPVDALQETNWNIRGGVVLSFHSSPRDRILYYCLAVLAGIVLILIADRMAPVDRKA